MLLFSECFELILRCCNLFFEVSSQKCSHQNPLIKFMLIKVLKVGPLKYCLECWKRQTNPSEIFRSKSSQISTKQSNKRLKRALILCVLRKHNTSQAVKVFLHSSPLMNGHLQLCKLFTICKRRGEAGRL